MMRSTSKWLLSSAFLVALFSAMSPMAAICVLVSPFLFMAHYTIAVIVTQLFRDQFWHYYNDRKIKGTRGTVIGKGEIRYADKSLVIGDVSPDDYDVTLPNPNTHKTSVPHSVVLHEPTGEEDLMINGLTYVDMSNLKLSSILNRVQENGGTFDDDTHDAMQKALKYHRIHLSSKGSSLFLLWVPKYGIMAWGVPPMGNNYPHSHCDSDLRGEPMYSMTRGLSPWLFHRLSFLQLVNIWFPAQPLPCKPLVVCDTTTLDKSDVFKHKLYNKKGTVDAFTHTYNPDQRWVVPVEWCPPMAVVFRTAWTPHTSSPLPGENLTSPLFEEIKRIRDCIEEAINDKSASDPCGELKVEKGALEEVDGETELIEKVPVLAKSLEELRSTLRELPRRCREAKGDAEKLQTLAEELDLILRRSVAMRIAVRAVVLRWDLTMVSVSVVLFLGTFWMFSFLHSAF